MRERSLLGNRQASLDKQLELRYGAPTRYDRVHEPSDFENRHIPDKYPCRLPCSSLTTVPVVIDAVGLRSLAKRKDQHDFGKTTNLG